jgi:hypothetical protein
MNDFSDKYYEGIVETITASDLRRESGFDDELIKKLVLLHNPKIYINYNQTTVEQLLDYKVDVLRFLTKQASV